MPSTFTSNTGIELIADGEQTGAWGQTTNDNFDIVDRALNGSVSISLVGTTHTLTTSDGVLSDGQFAVLVFTGSPSGTNTVTIAPNTAQKTYFVTNSTAQTVVLSQGSGANVSVPAGLSKIVFTNGDGATAAVFDITNTLSGTFTGNVTGNVTGNASTATALQTARTIGGVSFNGTANINLPGVNAAGNQNTTGNAASATALQTARTINGVSFNGTANITLPTVNTSGNQTIAGIKTFSSAVVLSTAGTATTQAVRADRNIATGTGILGGGNLTANRTLSIDIASQAEAQAGTDNAHVMTPLRVAQAIAALGGTNVTFTEFTSSGTYTKPAGANFIYVVVVGGGGSGAARASAGSGVTLNGGGGSGGTVQIAYYKATSVPSTVSVTVGAGGASISASSAQLNGNGGGSSTFGALLTAVGGFPGNIFSTNYPNARVSSLQPFGLTGADGGTGTGSFTVPPTVLGPAGGAGARQAAPVATTTGGTSTLGFGAGGFGRTTSTSGQSAGNGGFPGGGGGGIAMFNNSGTATSGAGGAGVVQVFSF